MSPDVPSPTPLVVACGALATDLSAVLATSGLTNRIEVRYLPANYHMHPERIVPALRKLIAAARAEHRPVFVAYADCGTGGLLDALLAEFPGIERLSGAHCYEFFAGAALFAELHDAEIGTFYLTDFLTKHFDALVWDALGLDRLVLRTMYFGNYTRVVLLAQGDDPAVTALAAGIAERLGLRFERRLVGRDNLTVVTELAAPAPRIR